MSVAFIPPTMAVISDMVVTPGELTWYAQEITTISVESVIGTMLTTMMLVILTWTVGAV